MDEQSWSHVVQADNASWTKLLLTPAARHAKKVSARQFRPLSGGADAGCVVTARMTSSALTRDPICLRAGAMGALPRVRHVSERMEKREQARRESNAHLATALLER